MHATRTLAITGTALATLVMLAPAAEAVPLRKVSVVDFAFTPATVTVNWGTRVRWTNTGARTHTVTSRTGLFDRTLTPGALTGFTFNNAGTFSYLCTIHTSMTGKVVVR